MSQPTNSERPKPSKPPVPPGRQKLPYVVEFAKFTFAFAVIIAGVLILLRVT